MLLRESGRIADENYGFDGVKGLSGEDGGVLHGRLLLDFAEAVLVSAELEISQARARLIEVVGTDGFVDAAGVVASFNSVVRIADGTGIPLEQFKRDQTVDLRAELGIDDWH